MADINLLQNQLKDSTLISIKRTKIVAWICLVLLLAMIGGATALYFMTGTINSQTAQVAATNITLQSQLSSQQEGLGSAQAYQAQLTNIKSLLKNHIAFSPLVEELAKYTYQRASYSIFDVDQNTGRVHVEGSVDTYSGLAKLLLGLSTSPDFRNVKLLNLSQVSGGTSGLTFSIDMNAEPGAFKKSQP